MKSITKHGKIILLSLYLVFIFSPSIYFALEIPHASTASGFFFPSEQQIESLFAVMYFGFMVLIGPGVLKKITKVKRRYFPTLVMLAFIIFITWAALNTLFYVFGSILVYKTSVIIGNPDACRLVTYFEVDSFGFGMIMWRDCVTEIATNKKNHSLCYAVKWADDECVLFTAIHLKATWLCYSFVPELKSECLYGIARDNRTIKTCGDDVGCISKYAEFHHNISVCFDLPQSNFSRCQIGQDLNLNNCSLDSRELCLMQSAVSEEKPEYCGKIENPFAVGRCLTSLANTYRKPKYCYFNELITHNAMLSSCLEIAEQ